MTPPTPPSPNPPDPQLTDPDSTDAGAVLSEHAPAAPHDPYIALRNTNYRRYFIGNAFSLFGTNMTTGTVAYELYLRTESSLVLGMVGLMQVLPIILLALPAGHFVDRFNRKKMILVATAMQMILCTLMGFSSRFGGGSHVPIMLGLLLLNGICRAVNQPAKQTLLPMLVPPAHFPNAITWSATLFETSNVLGPVASGLALLAMLGAHPEQVGVTSAFALIYWVNAACQLIQWINISRIELPHKTSPRHAQQESMFASIGAGIRFVHGNKVILSAITLDLFAVLLGGATALLPVFATHVLFVGPLGYNCLRAAPSIGAVMMAIVLAHSPPMKNAGRNLLIAVTGFGLAIIVFGLSRNYWVSLAALFITGIFDNISVVVRHTLVQLLTPDSMRGRVNSVNTVFISSSNELGEFESGTTAHIAQAFLGPMWGPMIAAAAGGAGTVLVVVIAALLWPQLAAVKRLSDLKQAKFDPSALQ